MCCASWGCYKGVFFSSTDEPAVIPSGPGFFGAPVLFSVLCSPQGLCRPMRYTGLPRRRTGRGPIMMGFWPCSIPEAVRKIRPLPPSGTGERESLRGRPPPIPPAPLFAGIDNWRRERDCGFLRGGAGTPSAQGTREIFLPGPSFCVWRTLLMGKSLSPSLGRGRGILASYARTGALRPTLPGPSLWTSPFLHPHPL